ncbi:MAG: hypothetical protein LBU66_00615 [Treponema sp.]|jgi:hypothetical protein|nr:hypothetical protein [Treponema sp.]
MKNKCSAAISAAISLFLILCFTGCNEEELPGGDDYNIGKITITGIPAVISVNDNTEADPKETFKVYFNASDSMDEAKPPKAKGLLKIEEKMKQSNGTYTVTINLQKPNPNIGDNNNYIPNPDNPNHPTGSWSGTANYFSIMISPQDTSEHGVDAIWAIGGYTLNKGKAQIEWNGKGMQDFRNKALPPTLKLDEKTLALYNDIVCKDPEITSE